METKKIIITGGATRIGRSIALELANYNTEIVIHYFKSFSEAKRLKIELENLGSTVYLFKADLNKVTASRKIISFAHKKMKGFNCLINNASIFEKKLLSFLSKFRIFYPHLLHRIVANISSQSDSCSST